MLLESPGAERTYLSSFFPECPFGWHFAVRSISTSHKQCRESILRGCSLHACGVGERAGIQELGGGTSPSGEFCLPDGFPPIDEKRTEATVRKNKLLGGTRARGPARPPFPTSFCCCCFLERLPRPALLPDIPESPSGDQATVDPKRWQQGQGQGGCPSYWKPERKTFPA